MNRLGESTKLEPGSSRAQFSETLLLPPLPLRAANGDAARPPKVRGNRRATIFRGLRLLLAAAFMAGAVVYGRFVWSSVTSDSGIIGGELVLLRAPIEGRLDLETIEPGRTLAAGTLICRIVNPRYGDRESMSRVAWASEYADRLRVETAEAEVRLAQQGRIYQRYLQLHDQRLISDLEFLEEQTKWAAAAVALTNRQAQLDRAESRTREALEQLELQKEAILTMPFDGVAGSLRASNGQQIRAHEPVLQLIDPRRIWVEAYLSGRNASRVRAGSVVELRFRFSQAVLRGRVVCIQGGRSTAGAGVIRDGRSDSALVARVELESANPFGPEEFYGWGQAVTVTLAD